MLRVRPMVLAGIAALVAAAGWFAWRLSRTPAQDRVVLVAVIDKRQPSVDTPALPDLVPAPTAVLPPTLQDYEARFRESEDLLAFLESVAPAAEAGDPDALY